MPAALRLPTVQRALQERELAQEEQRPAELELRAAGPRGRVPGQEPRREARVRPVVQGRARRWKAQARPVVQAVLEVGPRSCGFMLVNLLPVGWLTNRENPISAGSRPSMDSPASLP